MFIATNGFNNVLAPLGAKHIAGSWPAHGNIALLRSAEQGEHRAINISPLQGEALQTRNELHFQIEFRVY